MDPKAEIEEQKARNKSEKNEAFRELLAQFVAGEVKKLNCREVASSLEQGKWDDTGLALMLYPERVAQKCWEDSNLAAKLSVTVPEKQTKTAFDRFLRGQVIKGCPELVGPLRAVLENDSDTMCSMWKRLSEGEMDETELAFALWPERVIDKCAESVELAQSHCIAQFLWVKHPEGEWRRRKATPIEIKDEIARKTSH